MPNLFADDLNQFLVDPDKDYLAELVGDGKKFQTPQDLARAKAESDAHIARIEAEQKGIRDELATRINMEQFLEKLYSIPQLSNPEPTIVQGEPAKETSAMKPEDIEHLVAQKIRQTQLADTAQQNTNTVITKLQEVYGPNYVQHLKREAQELGMSETALQNIAASNPKAFFKLIGLEGKTENKGNLFNAPPKSQSTGFSPSPSAKKGDSYYEDIRKNKPETYWSPKIQNEIFDRIKEIGAEAFYNS